MNKKNYRSKKICIPYKYKKVFLEKGKKKLNTIKNIFFSQVEVIINIINKMKKQIYLNLSHFTFNPDILKYDFVY